MPSADSRDTEKQGKLQRHNMPLADARVKAEDTPLCGPTSSATYAPRRALEGSKDEMQSAHSEAADSETDFSSNADDFSQALAIYHSHTVDVEHYRRQAITLGQQLADHKFEAEETAYHLGCLVMQSIDTINHLAAVQRREAAIEAALNGVLNHAHRHGAAVEYPPVDRELRQRRAQRRPAHYFAYNQIQSNPTWEYHSQARRLGLDFSMDPSVINPHLERIWSSPTVSTR
ncbi:hypothetical protein BKA70DRAFT_1445793 [Coprinopsis sp. MPI-PUGE-AT-0042]|nr:hypothetical protein BKA70DRAFT_1244223 [Coprinopsis sp. MPI-PUGE-AT-0042]KAH6884015.1 hypothetical protein BKA70DRAFT_1237987 [Coprinopsis sp. MPI-PUGE-AT-0042]KAH6884619.1 hypothetical protein BKA70DRAFT_1445793 [Coprinopsis sp. MPI-PUGE-AT-0042]